MDFWESFFASVLANLITSIPVVLVAILVLWPRYSPIFRVWELSIYPRQPPSFNIVVSTRQEFEERAWPSFGEVEAALDLRDLFNNLWLRYLCQTQCSRPQLSANVNKSLLQNTNLILIGGPGYNSETVRELNRLMRHGLSYSFHKIDEIWTLWDNVKEKAVSSERYEYGIFIRAPHEKPGLVVNIFAGTHETGTLGAVDVATKSHFCKELLTLKKRQQIGNCYVALVRIEVQPVRGEPIIEDIRPLTPNPHRD